MLVKVIPKHPNSVYHYEKFEGGKTNQYLLEDAKFFIDVDCIEDLCVNDVAWEVGFFDSATLGKVKSAHVVEEDEDLIIYDTYFINNGVNITVVE